MCAVLTPGAPWSPERKKDGEVSEWSKERAWKACKSKGFEGSNPSLSATELKKAADFSGFFIGNLFLIHTLTHTLLLASTSSYRTLLD